MGSTSVARQNRRMRLKQNISALNIEPKLTVLSSEMNSSAETYPNFENISNVHTKKMNNDSTSATSKQYEKHEPYESLSYAASCDFLNSDILSQPVGKIFIEEENGFKEIGASEIFHISHSEISVQSDNEDKLINLAFKTAKYFHNLSNFCHGLLGGVSLLYILVLLHLMFDLLVNEDTVKYFSFFSKPVHNLFNFLCIICCISTFDRFDITNIKELLNVVKKLDFKLISLLIYPVCLILSLSTANVDDKLCTPHYNASQWQPLHFMEDSELYYWKTVSISKCFCALLGWMVICWDQNFNLLLNNIKRILHRRKLPLQ